MAHYDVFNGDADGIIALLQLRFAEPKEVKLISGVKRDIKLLDNVPVADADSVTVLDISMEKNKSALSDLLSNKVPVFYCDHHRAGDIPQSKYLESLINLDAEVCTSLLINDKLNGQYVSWAIAAAFGDNLVSTANQLAQETGLSKEQTEFLKELGILINYNGYGGSLTDLHIEPTVLYKKLLNYPNPFDLLNVPNSPYFLLKKGYEQDVTHTKTLEAIYSDSVCRVYELPDEAWARRISGVFSNELANEQPQAAHAVLTLNPNKNDYTVSVRAPLESRFGADEVCCQFATGGGRKAAAGINALPIAEKQHFVQVLHGFYK